MLSSVAATAQGCATLTSSGRGAVSENGEEEEEEEFGVVPLGEGALKGKGLLLLLPRDSLPDTNAASRCRSLRVGSKPLGGSRAAMASATSKLLSSKGWGC